MLPNQVNNLSHLVLLFLQLLLEESTFLLQNLVLLVDFSLPRYALLWQFGPFSSLDE